MAITIEIKGPNFKDFLQLGPKTKFIGRSAKCQVALKDGLASGIHLAIKISSSGNVIFKDLDSTNGTFKNNEKVKSGHLFLGEELLIGKTLIRIVESELSEFEKNQLRPQQEEKSIFNEVNKEDIQKLTRKISVSQDSSQSEISGVSQLRPFPLNDLSRTQDQDMIENNKRNPVSKGPKLSFSRPKAVDEEEFEDLEEERSKIYDSSAGTGIINKILGLFKKN